MGLTSRPAAQVVADLPARVAEIPADIVLFDVTGERALGEARMLAAARPETPVLALAVPELAEHVMACADVDLVGCLSPVATERSLQISA